MKPYHKFFVALFYKKAQKRKRAPEGALFLFYHFFY